MAERKIEELVEIGSALVKADKPRNDIIAKIDDGINCVYNPPKELTSLPWVRNRHFALPFVADARNAAVRTFSALMPQIEISPVWDTDAEYERTERAEQILGWEFERMNSVGTKRLLTQINESAVSYHAAAFQTEYLPFKYKGREMTPRQKARLAQSSFRWVPHHISTVHVLRGDDGIEGVLKRSVMSLGAAEREYGGENEGIVNVIQKAGGRKSSVLENNYLGIFDWTDWKYRVVWGVFQGTDNRVPGEIVKSDVVFRNEEHELPFINWVVVDNGTPLWESVFKSGLWDNVQHLELIKFAKAVEQSARPAFAIQTSDGTLEGIWIDQLNPSQPLVLPPGAQLIPLPPNQLDQQLFAMQNEMLSMVSQSTVSRILQDVSQISASTPYSSLNAMLQTAIAQLAPARQTAESAIAFGFRQMFEWVEHSNMPLISYRPRTTDGRTEEVERYRAGQGLALMPGGAPDEKESQGIFDGLVKLFGSKRRAQEADYNKVYFDLDSLYISVTLQSTNPTDEQARENLVINARERLGASSEWGWERLGYRNFKLVQEQRLKEDIREAVKQAEIKRLMAGVDLEMQGQQMQMQQQAQAAQMQNMQNANNQLNAGTQFAAAQGLETRAGGVSAAQIAPGETREQITGLTRGNGNIVR